MTNTDGRSHQLRFVSALGKEKNLCWETVTESGESEGWPIPKKAQTHTHQTK